MSQHLNRRSAIVSLVTHMSDTKWKTVRILSLLAEQIDKVFEKAGYSSKSSFVNDAVRKRLEELKTQVKTDENLTDEERIQLTEAANEVARAFGHLEEQKVRDYLKDNYYWWSKEKIERGVQFICALKIKN